MNHPNVTGATHFASQGVLTTAFSAAYTFHITIKVFRRAETVGMGKRRNRWTRRIRTTSWNSRRRVRSCTCPSVRQIPTSIFRPTVTAKPAGSPVGCARSRYSAGSAPRSPAAPFPRKLGQGTLPPWALMGTDSAQQSQRGGRYLGRYRPLFRCCLTVAPARSPPLAAARFVGSLRNVPCAPSNAQLIPEMGSSLLPAVPSALLF